MTAPRPHFVPPSAPTPQPETIHALSTLPQPMLQSLGSLLGIPLRPDSVSQLSPFNAWCTSILERMGEIGRLAFTPSRGNAAPSTSAWGLSFCETFLSHISQLPSRLMSLFSPVQYSSAQLQRYTQELDNPQPLDQLQTILSGFSTAISLYHLQQTGQPLPTEKCAHPAALSHPFSAKQYQALLKGLKGLEGHFKAIDPKATKALIQQIQMYLNTRKSSPSGWAAVQRILPPQEAHPGPTGPLETGEGAEHLASKAASPYDYHAWIVDQSLPVYAWSVERSATFVRYLSAQVQEITTIVSLLSRIYNVFGHCLGELIQTYQTLWLEYAHASGTSSDKKEAEMRLIEDITDDPELVQALQSSGLKSTSLESWLSIEAQSKSLQSLQTAYVDSVKAVKELWGTAGLEAQIEALKNDLCDLPEIIAPKWVQNAWESAVEVQDHLGKVGNAIQALGESTET